MNFVTISKKISVSQRTVIRRLEKLQTRRIITNFGITINPSMMKGYNYFAAILHTQKKLSKEIVEKISYSKLNDYLLTRPRIPFEYTIILNFYSENVSDIISISERLKNFDNVKKIEIFQPTKIKYYQDWLIEEIRNKILSFK